MTQNSLVDVLADIRYRLRHTSINEDFIEWLDEELHALRSRYRRSKAEFKSEDILFLQHLAILITTLYQYLVFKRRLVAFKRGQQLSHEFANLNQRIAEMREDSFLLIAKQCVALHSEFVDLYRVPNTAGETAAPTAVRPSP